MYHLLRAQGIELPTDRYLYTWVHLMIRALRRVLPPPGPAGYYSVADSNWAWPRVGMWVDLLRIRFKMVYAGIDEWASFIEHHGIVYRPAIWGTRAGRSVYVARSPLTQPYP